MRWDPKAYRDKWKKGLSRVRSVKTWQLVILLLISLMITATMFRVNNLNMRDLRREVTEADEAGDVEKIKTSVDSLGRYVSSHMWTDLDGGLVLYYSYKKAEEAAIQAAINSSTDEQGAIYRQANTECQSQGQWNAYLDCVQNKVKNLGGPDNLADEVNMPRYEIYKINFVSPLWSPDPAGFSVALSIFIMLAIVLRVTGAAILRLLLKLKFRSI